MAMTKMQLVDWLDDLCVRFIINLPQEELESVERICFQVEEAQWFYEDFIRPLDPSLPSMNLKKFCLLIFQHCPLLSDFSTYHHAAAYSEFLAYKTRVPVRGAIMLNEAMDEVVLVKGWKKGSRWGFPRGKINKDEKDLDCAVREVYEETGFDIQEAGLVKDESEMKYIEVTMREQHMRLYVFRGVPKSVHFEPRTRKEISKIDWYKLSDLPTQKKQRHGQDAVVDDSLNNSMFYMVAPFLGPLRRWIKQQKKLDRVQGSHTHHHQRGVGTDLEELETAEESAAFAGETTADEDMSGYIRAAHPQDSHFNQLLAGLRSSQQPSPAAVAPEMATEPTPVDAAAELKRLLSVSGPSGGGEEPINPLLAMLRGNNPTAGQPVPAEGVQLRTPIDQIVNVVPQPQSPHHQHPRPPPFSAMPHPPSFQYPPIQHQHQPPRNYQRQQPRTSISGQSIRTNGAHRNIPQGFHPSHAGMVPPNGFPGPQFPAHGPAIPQNMQEAPRPYQRTGDPQFAQNPQFPNVHGPAIPAASQLPPPKLNAHTLNLLNAFKNPETAKAVIASQGQAKFAEVYNTGKSAQPPPQPTANQPPAQLSSGLEALELSPPTTTQSPTPLLAAQQMPIPTMQPKPRSAHQDALLSLFRAPSTSSTSPLQSLLPGALAPEPVELAAQPSPGSMGISLAHPPEIAASPPIKLSIPNLTGNIVSQQPGLTSATVSGPLNEPNFDTLQRQRHTPQPQQLETNGKTAGSAAKHTGASFHSNSARSSPNPLASETPITPPSGVSVTLSGDDTLQKHPYHPKILRRPNQVPSPTSAPAFDRREVLPEQQKNTLLSLFSKAAPQANSGVASPVSPLPEKAILQHSPHGELPRSRLGSITSVPTSLPAGEGPKELEGGRENNLLHELSIQRQQAAKTPVTPVDRSFLLGYLEGVAKGDRK